MITIYFTQGLTCFNKMFYLGNDYIEKLLISNKIRPNLGQYDDLKIDEDEKNDDADIIYKFLPKMASKKLWMRTLKPQSTETHFSASHSVLFPPTKQF